MKSLFLTGVMTLLASHAFAQTPESTSVLLAPPRGAAAGNAGLATPTENELSAGIGSYTYREPGDQAISIHGIKFEAGYTGTLSLSKRQHWFAQVDLRGVVGNVAYNGWCSPFQIAPNSSSPNGYELDVGDATPCSETGDRDWYVEGRGLVGKDLIGQRFALSPYTGVGVRHLSNGTTGTPGYRVDNYLYLSLGVTARTNVASHRALSVNLEFDRLLHGWQTTHDSALGGGVVPATSNAPAFTIVGFSDISFAQSGGWALRAGGTYQVTRHWSVEPYYLHWTVSSSPVNYETATFTVNNITAREQIGAYEPFNQTNEFGVRLGLHF